MLFVRMAESNQEKASYDNFNYTDRRLDTGKMPDTDQESQGPPSPLTGSPDYKSSTEIQEPFTDQNENFNIIYDNRKVSVEEPTSGEKCINTEGTNNVNDHPKDSISETNHGKAPHVKSTKTAIKTAGQAVFGKLFKGSSGLTGQNSSGSIPTIKPQEEDETDDTFPYDGREGMSRQTAMKNFLNTRLVHAKVLMNFRRKKPRRKLVSNTGNPLWIPLEKPCWWFSVSGRTIHLGPTTMSALCSSERCALQQIALQRLQGLDLGCHLSMPKESSITKRKWKRILAAGRKASGSGIQSLFEKENKQVNRIFAVPLSQVVANDYGASPTSDLPYPDASEEPTPISKESTNQIISRRSSAPQEAGKACLRNPSPMLERSFREYPFNCETFYRIDEDDFSPFPNRRASRLFDALTLTSSSASSICILDRDSELLPQQPQVPLIVTRCIEYIDKYALHVLGIFRTGGSKKRVRQMKEDIEQTGNIVFDPDANPQDIAALFKEFFRDLPDPLLSRELYDAFLLTRQIENPTTQLMAVKYLISLLPVANRDTLKALLTCLSRVASCAADITDVDGEVVQGNKMDSRNLATLMGPNILHKAKSTGQPYSVDEAQRAEENKQMIEVVQEMIENCDELFVVEAKLHDSVLRLLLESDPEAIDYILRRKATKMKYEDIPDTVGKGITRSQEDLGIKVRRANTFEGPGSRPRYSTSGSSYKDLNTCPSPNLSKPLQKRTNSGAVHTSRSDSVKSDRSTYSDSGRLCFRNARDSTSSFPSNGRSQSDSTAPITQDGVLLEMSKNSNLHRNSTRFSDRCIRRKISAGESTLGSSPHSSRNDSRSSTPQSSPATSPRLSRQKTTFSLSRSQSDGSRKCRAIAYERSNSKEKSSGYFTDNQGQETHVSNELSRSPIFLSDVLDTPSFIKPSTNSESGSQQESRKTSLSLTNPDVIQQQVSDLDSSDTEVITDSGIKLRKGGLTLPIVSPDDLMRDWNFLEDLPADKLPDQETAL